MALNLKKRTILIVAIAIGVLSVGATGYIVWRTTVEEDVTPTVSEGAYDCLKDGVPVPCASIGKIRCHCPDGTWVIGTGGSCWDLCKSKGATTPGRTSSGGSCSSGSQCSPCEWPSVAYCGCPGDSNPAPNKCGCRPYNSTFSCGAQCGTVKKCTPNPCPSGWISCGVSGSSGAKASGCTAKTSCTGSCTGCGNEFKIKRYCRVAPSCGDGKLESGEECELGDPSGVKFTWAQCDHTTCTGPEPACGDGILGNTEGEECEAGDPDGVSCAWDSCNQSSCSCPEEEEPFCGDGILGNTDGEECELGDPSGVSCAWDVCNQTSCSCPEDEEEPSCGDGVLGNTEGEQCELGDPNGVSCLWASCNQSDCSCPEEEEIPELPETGIFDSSDIALAISVTMVIYGGVLGVIQYMKDGDGRRDRGIIRRLRL